MDSFNPGVTVIRPGLDPLRPGAEAVIPGVRAVTAGAIGAVPGLLRATSLLELRTSGVNARKPAGNECRPGVARSRPGPTAVRAVWGAGEPRLACPRPTCAHQNEPRTGGNSVSSVHTLLERACWPITGATPTTKQATPTSNADRTTADRLLEQGLLKRIPNLALTILGQPYTTADVKALLDKRIAAVDAVVQAHGALKSAVAAMRELFAQSRPVILAVKRFIRIQFENDAAALADFGMTPGTRKVQTAEEKAQATAKRLATRKQRGLAGKKAQKAAAAAETPATTAQPEAPAPAATTPKS